jgi:hypothetical protein
MSQEENAAGRKTVSGNTRSHHRGLSALIALRDNGVMPKAGLIWLNLGCMPSKRNALALDPDQLPTDDECKCVAGLDVVLIINGYLTKYSPLRRLCGSLLAARPRRLLLIDLDYQRLAFLKLEGAL